MKQGAVQWTDWNKASTVCNVHVMFAMLTAQPVKSKTPE
jgi:hypothetical protein